MVTTQQVLSRKDLLLREMAYKERLLEPYSITQELADMEATFGRMADLSTRRSEIVRQLLPAVQQELEGIEAELVLDIAGRVDDKGKALYGNAETRKAALDSLLRQHLQYQSLLADRARAQQEADQLEAEAQLEHRRYAAIKYAVEHKLASVRMLSL